MVVDHVPVLYTKSAREVYFSYTELQQQVEDATTIISITRIRINSLTNVFKRKNRAGSIIMNNILVSAKQCLTQRTSDLVIKIDSSHSYYPQQWVISI